MPNTLTAYPMRLREEVLRYKLQEFYRNQCMTRAELEGLQARKFRELARYAAGRSVYYRELVARHGIQIEACVPQDFPVLTKSLFMEHFDRIVTDPRLTRSGVGHFIAESADPNELLFNEYRAIYSSGSSGETGYFVYSRADWTRGMAQTFRGRRPTTLQGGRRARLAFYGIVRPHLGGVTTLAALTDSSQVEVLMFDMNRPLTETVAQLNDFRPDFLCGYTSALTILAAKQLEGALALTPGNIRAVGESMSAADEAVLRAAFGCEVTNAYASSEHLMMGFRIPGSGNMLLPDDDLIYEPHENHCFVTNLFNFTTPLIRYRMGDILRRAAVRARPALPYLEIESLIGRSEQTPVFLNEDGVEEPLSPYPIMAIHVPGIRRFQIRVRGNAAFLVRVCLDSRMHAGERAAALASMDEHLRKVFAERRMRNVRWEIKTVEDIPADAHSGKFKVIVPASTSDG